MDFRKKKTLGRTGLSVSRLGLAGGYGVPKTAVEKAFHEYGINYFYWSSPRKPGMREGLRALTKNHREKIIIVLQSYDHVGLTVRRSTEKASRAWASTTPTCSSWAGTTGTPRKRYSAKPWH
jgi:hypothetical protein